MSNNDYGLGLKVHEDSYRELEEKLAKAKAKLEEVGFRACCVLLERDELREQRDRLAEQKEANHKVTIAIGRMFHEAKQQRDRLAEELKEAQNAIEMMLRDSSCRRIPAYTEEQLAAVEGGSDE